jgi:hypothetical protein
MRKICVIREKLQKIRIERYTSTNIVESINLEKLF